MELIRSVSKEYKVFDENRLQEILKLTDIENWKYCDTKSNPADLITRTWRSSSNLKNESFWWNGPDFLYLPDEKCFFSSEDANINVTDYSEVKNVVHTFFYKKLSESLGLKVS